MVISRLTNFTCDTGPSKARGLCPPKHFQELLQSFCLQEVRSWDPIKSRLGISWGAFIVSIFEDEFLIRFSLVSPILRSLWKQERFPKSFVFRTAALSLCTQWKVYQCRWLTNPKMIWLERDQDSNPGTYILHTHVRGKIRGRLGGQAKYKLNTWEGLFFPCRGMTCME